MTIALVAGQTAYGTAGPGTTTNAVLPNNPTPGNFVVALAVASTGLLPTLTVKDSVPNTYTPTSKTPFETASNPSGAVGVFYLPNVPVGATKTLTLTSSATATLELFVAEFSGVLATLPFENDATNNTTVAATTIALPTYTTLNAGDLLVAVGDVSGSITSANSPWTGWPGGVPASGSYAEYLIKATAGAQAVNFTCTSSVWLCIEAAFKPAVDVLNAQVWM